ACAAASHGQRSGRPLPPTARAEVEEQAECEDRLDGQEKWPRASDHGKHLRRERGARGGWGPAGANAGRRALRLVPTSWRSWPRPGREQRAIVAAWRNTKRVV